MSNYSRLTPLQVPSIILAGGEGSRLRPLTDHRPKPLVAFGSRRLIDFTLLNCRRSELAQSMILTQHRQVQIAAHVRDTWGSEARCQAPFPGEGYRGTADAVYRSLPFFQGADHVLILAGDHVYQMDYRNLLRSHLEWNADLTISTIQCPIEQARNYGVVRIDRRSSVESFVEKPLVPKPLSDSPGNALVSMGIYAFKVSTLVAYLEHFCGHERGFDFGRDIVPALVSTSRVYAYDFSRENFGRPAYWRDVGDIDTYYRASMESIDKAASGRISRSVVCGPATISDSADISDSVLMPNVIIPRDVRLRRVIVDEGVAIPRGFSAGLDPEADRDHFRVSREGVVVINQESVSRWDSNESFVAERHLTARSL